MPPKRVTKQSLASYSAPKEQTKQDKYVNQDMQEDFIDAPNYKYNMQTLSSTRTVLSIVIGLFCGIINLNQLFAVVLYAVLQVAVSPLILFTLGNSKKYFLNKSDAFTGIAGSVLMFVCSWMISYNLVYTL